MAGEEVVAVQAGLSTEAEMAFLRRRLMLRRLRRAKPSECKMSLTPMIDIVFLLIFFFMVVTDLSNMEIESVALPFALEAREDIDPPPDRLIVNITEKGKIRMMRRTVSLEELERELAGRAQRSQRDEMNLPTVAVKIRADSRAEYKHIQQVMIRCMRAFIWRLSFGVRPAPSEESMQDKMF